MDINQLKCFISVAQTLNFSEAARRNYVSQSTVSRYISDLEKEFDVQLFSRSHRDVIITNEGKTLLPYAIEIVDTLKKAKSVIRQMHDGGQGKIVLGCDVTSLGFPSKCIADFNEKYPNITVEVRRLNRSDNNQDMLSGDYDFCFMPRDMVPENSGIETLVTHNEQLAVMASRDIELGKGDTISLSNLSNQKLMLLSETITPILYMEIMDLLRTFHLSPEIDSSFVELVSLYVAVSSGLGVSVIPTSLAKLATSEFTRTYFIDDADTSIAYVMAWNKNMSNPAAKLFVESVKKFAKGEDNPYTL